MHSFYQSSICSQLSMFMYVPSVSNLLVFMLVSLPVDCSTSIELSMKRLQAVSRSGISFPGSRRWSGWTGSMLRLQATLTMIVSLSTVCGFSIVSYYYGIRVIVDWEVSVGRNAFHC
ncbi:uncharacterized protein [Triticum aestivum]|uniref:uncharacterized protein n=1 Tax=Triticum aestivum TaxID=4565 RepID=UPI001D009497|nr:uncharacterized protein LOC123144442 [Triticum aestivum]